MRVFDVLLASGLLSGAVAQCPGSWYLQPNDCICMNSTDGALLKSQTLSTCKSLGYKTYTSICAVDEDYRQTFKDACKDLNQENVIGHCR